MQTAETASTRDANEILLKIIESTYVKLNLKQVFNKATQLNYEERTQLLALQIFSGLFYGTLGDWDTEPVDLGQNPGSKPFSSKYYLVPRLTRRPFARSINLSKNRSVNSGTIESVQ